MKLPKYLHNIHQFIAESAVEDEMPKASEAKKRDAIKKKMNIYEKEFIAQSRAHANPTSPRARAASQEFREDFYTSDKSVFGRALANLQQSEKDIVEARVKAAIMQLSHLIMIYQFNLRPTRRLKHGPRTADSDFGPSDFEYSKGDSLSPQKMAEIERHRYYRLLTSAVVHSLLIPAFRMSGAQIKSFFQNYLSGFTAQDLRSREMRKFLVKNVKEAMMPAIDQVKVSEILESHFDKVKDSAPRKKIQ